MVILDEITSARLMELVVPYVGDIEYVEDLIRSHLGIDTKDLITELDGFIDQEKDASTRTDLRIVRNAVEKL